jgi:nucleoside-diphosphate-sugar epimerase
MAHYLVTGAAGFIGSNLVETLLAAGERVAGFDNFATGKRENLAFAEGLPEARFRMIEADIRDRDALQKACAGVDYVLHQAALGSVPRSMKEPALYNDVNITGTLNVLLAARDAGVKRVVYAASSSAYGDTPTLPKHEAMRPMPLSPYAATKLAGEYYCRIFTAGYGLETVALRYFNVFGQRQDPHSQYAAVLPAFVTALLDGRSATIHGDGEQSRDFTHVENVVQANRKACVAPADACGEVYNVACGGRVTVNRLYDTLARLLGREDVRPVRGPARPGDVKHSLADITAAREKLAYDPGVTVEEGLARTVDWYRESFGGR